MYAQILFFSSLPAYSSSTFAIAVGACALGMLLAIALAVHFRFQNWRESEVCKLVTAGYIPHPAFPEYDHGWLQWEITSPLVPCAAGTSNAEIETICEVPRFAKAAAYRVAKGLQMAGIPCRVHWMVRKKEGFSVNCCQCGWQVTLPS